MARWHVELNSDTLPRLLVNTRYYAKVTTAARDKDAKTYLTECLNNANWLVKSLDQRARTILKVASEIVRQQDGFLTHGVRHLRPLNLRTIADAISMHESTVSRVTSNKYISTPRGVFELKYFFTASIQSVNGAEAHSAEAVRDRIREMIENEEPARFCPTTASSRCSRPTASISRAAPSPNIAKPCEFPRRWNAAGSNNNDQATVAISLIASVDIP